LIEGLNRRRAWARLALRNETQWKPIHQTQGQGRRRLSFTITVPGRGKARDDPYPQVNQSRRSRMTSRRGWVDPRAFGFARGVGAYIGRSEPDVNSFRSLPFSPVELTLRSDDRPEHHDTRTEPASRLAKTGPPGQLSATSLYTVDPIGSGP
jgi:hypothetical protein